MTIQRPELPEIQQAGSPKTPAAPLKPTKKRAHIGQAGMASNAEAQMERALGIGQAYAITKGQNRSLEIRRRARERAIAHQLEKAANNPMKNAKRFVRK
jgi:hypothetical protein